MKKHTGTLDYKDAYEVGNGILTNLSAFVQQRDASPKDTALFVSSIASMIVGSLAEFISQGNSEMASDWLETVMKVAKKHVESKKTTYRIEDGK
jgi:hypothetical protein